MKSNNEDVIKRETFRNANPETKWDLFYDLLSDVHKRVVRLENSKSHNTAYAAGGGVIGGFLALAGKWLIHFMNK